MLRLFSALILAITIVGIVPPSAANPDDTLEQEVYEPANATADVTLEEIYEAVNATDADIYDEGPDGALAAEQPGVDF